MLLTVVTSSIDILSIDIYTKGKRVFITYVKGSFFGMSESGEAS